MRLFNSIRFRLFLWFLLVFSGIALAFQAYLYHQQKKTLMANLDFQLTEEFHLLAGLIEVYPDGKVEFELTEEGHDRSDRPSYFDVHVSGHYYQVFDQDGTLVAKSPSLGARQLPLVLEDIRGSEGHFMTVPGPDNEAVRVYSQRIVIGRNAGGKQPLVFIVQTAESSAEITDFLAALREQIIFSTPLFLFLAGCGGVVVARLSLRSLKRFSQDVGEITEKNLDRRISEARVSMELKELAGSFNATLDRIEGVFKSQKRFISDAAHELRTPVSVIKSYCEIPLRKERPAEEYRRALETIQDNVGRLETLIEKLLTLSHLEEKRFPMNRETVDLIPLAGTVVSLLQTAAKENEVEIACPAPNKAVCVQGDRTALTEVLMNLLENAIKYNRRGGKVAVHIDTREDRAVVEVSDTGVGIPEASQAHIFERFYQRDYARSGHGRESKQQARGVGLGLSIVKEIVEAHNGRIMVKSEVGAGSTFKVFLPMA